MNEENKDRFYSSEYSDETSEELKSEFIKKAVHICELKRLRQDVGLTDAYIEDVIAKISARKRQNAHPQEYVYLEELIRAYRKDKNEFWIRRLGCKKFGYVYSCSPKVFLDWVNAGHEPYIEISWGIITDTCRWVPLSAIK